MDFNAAIQFDTVTQMAQVMTALGGNHSVSVQEDNLRWGLWGL